MAGEEVPEVEGIDHLYEAEPGDFVVVRDRLVKALKAGGDREAATAVKKLRRPTVVAWAVNQVVRKHRGAVGELVEATADVRRAQDSALGGGDRADGPDHGAGGLREAARRRRQIVSTLARAAAELAGSAHHDQAAATIDAASLDPDAVELFRRGRLSRELPPPSGFGFGVDIGVEPEQADGLPPPPAPAPAPAPPIDLEPYRREVERAEEAVAVARDEMGRAEESVAVAELDLKRAEDALLGARAGVAAARDELDRAVGTRDRAQDALTEAAPGSG